MAKHEVKQDELNGMPEMDEVGRAAKDYVETLVRIEKATIEKRDKADVLIQAMRRVNRVFIKVEGRTVTLSHIEEQDVIKVKK